MSMWVNCLVILHIYRPIYIISSDSHYIDKLDSIDSLFTIGRLFTIELWKD